MIRLAPQGKHLAFEPLPDKYEKLVKGFPTSLVYPYALGGNPGTVTFHCMLKHPALSGLKRRLRDLPNERVREVQVPMETVDRLVSSDLRVAFVKIDVEGGELGVFQGGIQTFRRARPVIVFECGLGGADYFGTGAESIFDVVVNEIGLKISLLGGWLSGLQSLSRHGFVDQFEKRINFYFVAHP
jgi:FkbM family methyltransferase